MTVLTFDHFVPCPQKLFDYVSSKLSKICKEEFCFHTFFIFSTTKESCQFKRVSLTTEEITLSILKNGKQKVPKNPCFRVVKKNMINQLPLLFAHKTSIH